MTFYPHAVQQITVRTREGTDIANLTGPIRIQGGDGFAVESDRADNEIKLSSGQATSSQDSRYRRKYNAIVGGGTFIDDDETVMNFSGMPYYIAAVNGSQASEVGNLDFLSTPCGQVGILRGGSILNASDELELLDICEACVDCKDYEDIKELLDRIEEFQDWDVTRNLYDKDEDGELALFRQYQSTIHFWNYLVHRQTIPLIAMRGSQRFLAINTGYYNKACTDLTDVVQYIHVKTTWCDCDPNMSQEEKDAYEHGEITVRLTNVIKHPEDLPDITIEVGEYVEGSYIGLPDGVVPIGFCEEGSVWIKVTYPTMSYADYIFYQLTIRSDKEMCDADIYSVWCNTHLTIPAGESEDQPGDQCIYRKELDVLP